MLVLHLEKLVPALFDPLLQKIQSQFSHLEIAEDIASDTFLKAYELWEREPLPPNPTAWLYTVAKNKAKDYEKHVAIFQNKVKKVLTPTERSEELTFETSEINLMLFKLHNVLLLCLASILKAGFSENLNYKMYYYYARATDNK